MILDDFSREFSPISKLKMRAKSKELADILESKGYQFSFSSNKHYGTTSPKYSQLEYGLIESMTDGEIDYLKTIFTKKKGDALITEMRPEFLNIFQTISKKSSTHYQVDDAYNILIQWTFDMGAILDNDWPMQSGQENRKFVPAYIRFICEYFGKINYGLYNFAKSDKSMMNPKFFDSLKGFIDKNYSDLFLFRSVSNQYGGCYDLFGYVREFILHAGKDYAVEINNGKGDGDDESIENFTRAMSVVKNHDGIISTTEYRDLFTMLKDKISNKKVLDAFYDSIPANKIVAVFGSERYDMIRERLTKEQKAEILYSYYTDKRGNEPGCFYSVLNDEYCIPIDFYSNEMVMDFVPPYFKSIDQKTCNMLDEKTIMYLYENGSIIDWKRAFKATPFKMDTLMSEELAPIVTKYLQYIYSSQKITIEFCDKYPAEKDVIKNYLSKNKTLDDVRVVERYEADIDWEKFQSGITNPEILDDFYAKINFTRFGDSSVIEGMRNKDALCYLILKYSDTRVATIANKAISALGNEERKGS